LFGTFQLTLEIVEEQVVAEMAFQLLVAVVPVVAEVEAEQTVETFTLW
jgi:hypothetical protein